MSESPREEVPTDLDERSHSLKARRRELDDWRLDINRRRNLLLERFLKELIVILGVGMMITLVLASYAVWKVFALAATIAASGVSP